MKPVEGKILVSVDINQKGMLSVDGNTFFLSKDFSHNRRESNPVVCKVEEGNQYVLRGTFLLVHHNRFVEHSPHHVENHIYSLPWNESVFAKLDLNGDAKSVCNNIIVDYIYENQELVPEQLKKPNKFKYKIKKQGFGFKKNQIVFAYEFANYEIVYVWNGVEKRVVKVIKNDIFAKQIK